MDRLSGVLMVPALLACAGGAAAAAPSAERMTIGTSAGGRAIEVVAVGEGGTDAFGRGRDDRPALLIVAGTDGVHTIGSEVARALVSRLLDEHAGLLGERTVYVLASANPDGAAAWAEGSPRGEWGRAPWAHDADGDGRVNEDPGDDINGDGLITVMRVPAPVVGYGIEASMVIDGDDSRVMREPNTKKGERATHAVLVEGLDNDGDGLFNEDGRAGSGGGVSFDMHWPTMWPEHTDGAGLYPLERPGARAITEWIQSRTNIVSVVVLGMHDTLAKAPESGKFGPVGEVPTGIEKDDGDAWGRVVELYKESTGFTGAGEQASRDGSLLQWAYSDLGVWAFGSRVWDRPDLIKRDAGGEVSAADDSASDAADDSGDAESAAMALAIARDRAEMADAGVPSDLIEFIYMTPEERSAALAAMDDEGPEAIAAIQQVIRQLPMNVQQRLQSLASGGNDPYPPVPTEAELAQAGGAEPGSEANKGGGKKKGGDSPDAKWLAWMDEHGHDGFVAWETVEHPQLGTVEVGGFVPGSRVNPPPDEVAGLVDGQSAFIGGLLGMLPILEIGEPIVERVGGGLWRVSLSATNTGGLDTVPAIGVKARRLPGLVMVLDPEQALGGDAIVSGGRVARFDTVGAHGGVARGEWLVAADAGETVRVEIRSVRFGDRAFDVRLEGE